METRSASTTAFLGRRWLCMAAALVICICAGVGYAWSVLQTPIVETFRWPASQVSLAYTVTVLCSTMAPLLFAPVIRKLGTRGGVILGAALYGGGLILSGVMSQVWQLYLFYGMLSGLGTGFIYPSMMAYVVRLFPDRAGMASGLGTAAYGSGAILWAPIAVTLINGFSLSAAFFLLGGGFLVIIVLGALVLRDPPEGFREEMAPAQTGAAGSASDLRRGQMVRTTTFYVMVAVFTCGLVAGVIVISQASPILQQACGFDVSAAAIFVSVFAACNMAGRFLWGALSDKLGIPLSTVCVFCLCILSMVVLGFFAGNVVITIAAMGVAASCYGGAASVLTPYTAQMFGARYITENYGVMYVVFGLASLIGPTLAVRLSEASGGSYSGVFFVAAGIALVGLILTRFLKSNVA